MTELIDRDDVLRFFYHLLDPISIPKYILKKPARSFENEYIVINCHAIYIHYNYTWLEAMFDYKRINDQYIKKNEPPIPIKNLSHGHLEYHHMMLSEAVMESNMIIQTCRVNINCYVRNISRGEPDYSRMHELAKLVQKTLQGVSTSNYIIHFEEEGVEIIPAGSYSFINSRFHFLLIHS